jgi:hypothetical protein
VKFPGVGLVVTYEAEKVMTEMHSDERIYTDMTGPISREDLQQLRDAWARATEKAGDPNLRIVFLACVNAIGAMGPAYCRIAAHTLLKRAADDAEN